MCKRSQWLLLGCFLVVAIIFTGWVDQVQSQEKKYPTRAIELICPFAAGGTVDMAGRIVAFFVNKKWGVPVNVINKPGGNTVPALMEVYGAEPNGYTMFVDCYASSPALGVAVENLPFNILDRTFIATVCSNSAFLIVPANSPYKNLNDLVADCRKNPETFTWASLGGTGMQDIVMRKFFKKMGVDVLRTKPVMFKGGTEAVGAIAGGHVKAGTASPAAAAAAAKAGIVRMLANTTERDPDFPNVATLAELGYPINAQNWSGISGPPKLPSPIVAMWEKVLDEIMKEPEFLARLKAAGQSPWHLHSREMREYVKEETAELAELYKVKKK